jgi:LysR family transcriptional regulator, glycine cleavage system transcriptional activator
MARRLPSLNALKAFEAAGRHGCFTLAASELNVSQAAISRHIRELEADLGAKLFHRTGRGVELTDDGEELSKDLTPVFDQLAAAVQRFAAPRGRMQLVVSAEVPFATLWLVPRLGEFTSKNPDIDLVLDPTNRLVDFAKNEADFGIRYGAGTWRDVDASKLIESEMTLVCSPAYQNAHAINAPSDIARATLLQEESKQHWIDWLKAAGLEGVMTPKGVPGFSPPSGLLSREWGSVERNKSHGGFPRMAFG